MSGGGNIFSALGLEAPLKERSNDPASPIDAREASVKAGQQIQLALGIQLPQLDAARVNTAKRMARQGPADPDPGKLWPLDMRLESFDAFGSDIAQYMFFLHRALRLFMTIFLINLSNIVISMEGTGTEWSGPLPASPCS